MQRIGFFLLSLLAAIPCSAAPRLDAGSIAGTPFDQAVAAVVLEDRVIVAGNASGERVGVAVYRQAEGGALELQSSQNQYRISLTKVAALAVSPDHGFLYVLGELGETHPRMLVFSVDGNANLQLRANLPAEELGSLPAHLAISPDGGTLYASSEFGLAAYRCSGASLELRQRLSGAFDRLLVSPDGRSLYATGALATLSSYRLDPATGLIEALVDSFEEFSAFGLEVDEARDLAQSPDGKYLYLLAGGSPPPPATSGDAVLVFENMGNSSLTLRSRGPGSARPAYARRIAVNPRNGVLYLATSDYERGTARLASFPARDGGRDFFGLSSAVSASEYQRPLALAADASGDRLYVGQFDGLAVEALSTAGFPGALDRLAAPAGARGIGGLLDLAISPEKGRVFVTSASGGIGFADADGGPASLRGVTRIPGHPALERVVFLDETRFVGLFRAFDSPPSMRLFELAADGTVAPRGEVFYGSGDDVWLSPDGRHLFQAGSANGLLHFEYRASPTPALIWRGRVEVQEPSFDFGPMRFSTDGRSMLVVAHYPRDRALQFRFDPASGQLQAEPDDPELAAETFDYAFSPDGGELYVLKYDGYEFLRVEVRRRGPGGSWSTIVQRLDLDGEPLHWSRQARPPQMILDASGRRLAVLDPNGHRILHLERDVAEGTLELSETRAAAITPSYFDSPYLPARLVFGPGGNDLWLLDPNESRIEASRWGCDRFARGELCLGQNGRFRVEADWSIADDRGAGERVVAPSADSGLFYFFDQNNWEMLVKVLDGCSINGHFWFFAAATTDVGYTLRVTDTLSGRAAVYRNTRGTASPAITDSEALAVCPDQGSVLSPEDAPPMGLAGDPEALVLRDRFELSAGWRTGAAAGAARVAPFGAADSGIFYFFSGNNWEMLVKVLDGCAINGHFWVLAAASTDVGFTLEVKDRSPGGGVKTYTHPGGAAAPAIIDLQAFSCASAAGG